ncbi:MAG TPA: glutaredoxin family protein [Candidatus Acidoferrales bacterium]|nr:glutaredoxin family protein [Candidatus Acidoferrales bacterium]
MDAISQRVLEVYDELAQERLDLHALMEFAGGNDPAKREAVVEAVETLVRAGYLDSAGGGDFYRRSEEGRLAVAGPRDVTLYTRPGCHLCDQAREAMLPIVREFGASLREVNIDDDADLRELYTNDVPVVFLGSREVARHRVAAARFRRALEEAGK